MIKAFITIIYSDSFVSVKSFRPRQTEEIYNYLTQKKIGHKLADDAASWCELASIGEVYDGGIFEIELEDI